MLTVLSTWFLAAAVLLSPLSTSKAEAKGTMVVGLVQVGPDLCRVDLLNPDGSLYTFDTRCAIILPKEDTL
jgi:hypothetical protein